MTIFGHLHDFLHDFLALFFKKQLPLPQFYNLLIVLLEGLIYFL